MVVHQNCEKGIAPSGRLMLQEAMKFIPASAPGHVRQSLMNTFGSQGRSSRKWLANFRHRWGARIGKMKIRFGMDMSEVREKATTYFRSANYVRSCVPVGKRTLMINMDETALAYSGAGQKGTIVCRDRLPNGRSLRTEQASRNDMRGNVTHMAFICDDSSHTSAARRRAADIPQGLKFNVENYVLWPTTQAEEAASLLNVAGASPHTAPALADSTDSPIAARTRAQARRQAGSIVAATSSSSSSSRGVATTAVVVPVRPPNRRSLRMAQRQLSNAL
ncbi:unnamed protein product [Polarella glacialis]|uniref:Uncharacterized protein n=1 Tax=Polarella glacialis TaxID=89957 RepID=A0A813FG88_POLGL|nr:unnamed protein product [Polarella glacialis]